MTEKKLRQTHSLGSQIKACSIDCQMKLRSELTGSIGQHRFFDASFIENLQRTFLFKEFIYDIQTTVGFLKKPDQTTFLWRNCNYWVIWLVS